MGGETIYIKELADTVANEIFEIFEWEKGKYADVNWKCEFPEEHKNPTKKDKASEAEDSEADSETDDDSVSESKQVKASKHPCDGVYSYKDPYIGKHIYLNFDFKSYQASSLSGYGVIGDLRSLGKALECANISPEFKKLYVNEKEPHFIDGVLFVYNHDGKYDKNFSAHLKKKIPSTGVNTLKGNNRIFILGPEDIVELYTVASHYSKTVGMKTRKGKILESGFLSPDLQYTKVKTQKVGPATIEMLTSSWIMTKISTEEEVAYYIYLKADHMNVKGFKYLIDAILQFQLLNDTNKVSIIDIKSDPDRLTAFTSAMTEYIDESQGVNGDSSVEFKSRMKRIVYESLNLQTPSFFERELSYKNNG